MTKPRHALTRFAALTAAFALAACEILQPQPEAVKPKPRPVAAPAPPAAAAATAAQAAQPSPPVPDRPGLTMNEYQKEVASSIAGKSSDQTFRGKLPPLLRSVVVLQVSIDSKGMPSSVAMFRSNGFVELEKIAIAAVYRGAPYPIPGRSLLSGHANVTFLESFLFRNDGRFQVRTIAEEQSTVVEPQPSGRGAKAKPPDTSK
jgi:protein TonB